MRKSRFSSSSLRYHVLAVLMCCATDCSALMASPSLLGPVAGVSTSSPTRLALSTRRRHFTTVNMALGETTADDGSLSIFTGGAFEKEKEVERKAIQIASKIRTVKDLGWTKPPKRKGSIRPRHRAWGGQGEKPVQLKANYDESSPACVERWLTQEEFYRFAKDESPAADTVFVALAGGGAFAERDVVESALASWRSGGKNQFNDEAFLRSVKKGRTDLAIGWAGFTGFNLLAASFIVAPTNPLATGLTGLIDGMISG